MYNLKYLFKGTVLELHRHGYVVIITCEELWGIDEEYLNEFCASSPMSREQLKKLLPYKFVVPKKGDYIAVKSNDKYHNGHSIFKFKGFMGSKIICKKHHKKGKISEWDHYQILNGDYPPTSDLWMNTKGQHSQS